MNNQKAKTQLKKITRNHLYFGSFIRSLRLWNDHLPKKLEMDLDSKGKKLDNDLGWVRVFTDNSVSLSNSSLASKLLSGEARPSLYLFADTSDRNRIFQNLRILLSAENGQCENTEYLIRFLEYIISNDRSISVPDKKRIAGLSQRYHNDEPDSAQKLTHAYYCVKEIFLLSVTDRTLPETPLYFSELPEVEEIGRTFSLFDTLYTSPSSNKAHLHSNVPHPVGSFVGRQKEFSQIDEAFFGNDNVPGTSDLFLTGVSGIGKSELAKQYAAIRLGDGTFQYVLYGIFDSYSGDRQSNVTHGNLVKIMNEITAGSDPENDSYENLTADLSSFASQCEELYKSGSDMLFIIDNLNVPYSSLSPEDMKCWDALSRIRCKRLITSTITWDGFKSVEIKRLEENEISLFCNHAKSIFHGKELDAVRELINDVDGHTLTIELLGRALRAERRISSLSPSEMLRALRKNGLSKISSAKVTYWKDNKAVRQPDKVSRILSGLFGMSSISDTAMDLLCHMALFPASGISKDYFDHYLGIDSFSDCLEEMDDRGWILFPEDDLDKSIRMHPLIAQVVGEHILNLPERNTKFVQYLYALYESIEWWDIILTDEVRDVMEFTAKDMLHGIQKYESRHPLTKRDRRNITVSLVNMWICVAENIIKLDILCNQGSIFIRKLYDFIYKYFRYDYAPEDFARYQLALSHNLDTCKSLQAEALDYYDHAASLFKCQKPEIFMIDQTHMEMIFARESVHVILKRGSFQKKSLYRRAENYALSLYQRYKYATNNEFCFAKDRFSRFKSLYSEIPNASSMFDQEVIDLMNHYERMTYREYFESRSIPAEEVLEKERKKQELIFYFVIHYLASFLLKDQDYKLLWEKDYGIAIADSDKNEQNFSDSETHLLSARSMAKKIRAVCETDQTQSIYEGLIYLYRKYEKHKKGLEVTNDRIAEIKSIYKDYSSKIASSKEDRIANIMIAEKNLQLGNAYIEKSDFLGCLHNSGQKEALLKAYDYLNMANILDKSGLNIRKKLCHYYMYTEKNSVLAEGYFKEAVAYPIRLVHPIIDFFHQTRENRNKSISYLLEHWQKWYPQFCLEDENKAAFLQSCLEPLIAFSDGTNR